MSFPKGFKVAFEDSANLDAFGRLRTSELITQLDVKQSIDDQPLILDKETVGTGSATYEQTHSRTNMTTTSSSDAVVVQTKQRATYITGKSQLIFITFAHMDHQTSVDKYIGYFNSSTSSPYTSGLDGLFLKSDGSDYTLEIWRDGVATEQQARANWDDPMDGTGKSKITLDFGKTQILCIDFEWLGVGRVRFGFIVDGQFVPVWSFNNANNKDNVYMQNPNHSIRWQIEQNAGTAGRLEAICGSVSSEGSINELAKTFSVNNGTTALSATVAGTKYMGVALRLADPSVFVKIVDVAMLGLSNDAYIWELILNPTIAGSPSWSSVTNSQIEYWFGATANTVTGGTGTVIANGFGSAESNQTSDIETAFRLGESIAGTEDVIALVLTPVTTGLSILPSMGWQEIS